MSRPRSHGPHAGASAATTFAALAERPRLILTALLVLSALLRAWHMDWMSIWQDEGLSLYRATKDVPFILSGRIQLGELVTRDVQPPLYFLLLAGWFSLVGVSTWFAKWLSLLVGLPTIPLVWALGRRWLSGRVGLVAACLSAMSPVYLWYSQEIRSYTLQVTLGLLAVYCLVRALGSDSAQRRIAWSAGSAAANALLLWTHYLGFFLLVLEALLVATRSRLRAPRRMGSIWLPLVPLVGLAAVALPLLPFAIQRLGLGAETDQQFVPLSVMLFDVVHGFTFGWLAQPQRAAALDVLVAALLVLGMLWLWRCRHLAMAPLAGYLLLPVVGLFCLTLVKPVYMGVRHILLASPAFYVLVATGIVAVRRRHAGLALAAGSLVAVGMGWADWSFYNDSANRKDDLRAMAQYVEARSVPGDLMLVSDPRLKLSLDQLLRSVPVKAVPDYLPWGALDARPPDEQLAGLLARHARLWFMTPLPEMKAWLEAEEDGQPQRARLVDQRHFPGRTIPVRLDAYEAVHEDGQSADTSGAERPATYDLGGLSLDSYWRHHPRGPLVAGAAARVGLSWRTLREVPDYKVSLQLLDADGRNHAQGDHEPFHGLNGTSRWPLGTTIEESHDLLVGHSAAPGEYRLAITVYDTQTGAVYPTDGPLMLANETVVRPSEPVAAGELPVGQWLHVRGGGLEVLGHDLPPQTWAVGQELPLGLWLRAVVSGAQIGPTAARVEILDRLGRRVSVSNVPVGTVSDAPAGWRPGDVSRLAVAIAAPRRPGRYGLRLALLQQGMPVWLRRGPVPVRSAWLGWVEVRAPGRRSEEPEVQHELGATIGEAIELVGYDMAGAGGAPVHASMPGSTLAITLHWRCTNVMATSYHVTVQLVPSTVGDSGRPGPAGGPVAQHDGLPAAGSRPTTGWVRGELVADAHTVNLPADLAAGEYLLIAALYDRAAPNLPRLPVYQDGLVRDFALLRKVIISHLPATGRG